MSAQPRSGSRPVARRRRQPMSDQNSCRRQARASGARVPRKEDCAASARPRQFVSDMILPGQSEVAFLRSPVAHGRILRASRKPAGREDAVFVARRHAGRARRIVAPSHPAELQALRAAPARARQGALRRRADRLCVAPTRAEAEDLAEQVEVDFEELPVLVDAHARAPRQRVRVHEEWDDNLFLTLQLRQRLRASMPRTRRRGGRSARSSCRASPWCRWKARPSLAVLGRPRATSSSSTARRRCRTCMRVGIAQFLGIDEEQVRVIAPDVGGGFGYKCIVQPGGPLRRLARAEVPQAVPLHRGPPRAPGGGRQLAPAPLRPHRLRRRARPAARARRRDHDRRRRLFELAVHRRPRAGPGHRQPAGPVRFPRLSLQDLLRRDQQARASCPTAAWRAPACASPWS